MVQIPVHQYKLQNGCIPEKINVIPPRFSLIVSVFLSGVRSKDLPGLLEKGKLKEKTEQEK